MHKELRKVLLDLFNNRTMITDIDFNLILLDKIDYTFLGVIKQLYSVPINPILYILVFYFSGYSFRLSHRIATGTCSF